jgi:prepilin-type processing-associated H-X9-DG protein
MPQCSANQAAGVGYLLFDRIEPYAKSVQLFKCPSDSTTTTYAGKSVSTGAATSWNVSYGYNYVYMLVSSSGNNAGVSLAAIQSVAQTVMMTDSTGRADYIYPPQYKASLPPYGGTTPRHLDGANVLWCDGHVKWSRPEALMGPAGCTGAACDELWDLN